MTPEDIIGRVFDIPPDTIRDETAAKDVAAWDSLGHVNLVLELEQAYGVSLTIEDALAMKSVGLIKRLLRERGAAW